MIRTNNFVGCRVLIRSEEVGETLADTLITAYDKTNIIITVNAPILQNHLHEKASVLIFGRDTLYEYGGTIRRYHGSGNIDIALFRGKVKEARGFKRYEINVKGTINSVQERQQPLLLRKPIEVELVNISATGVLFRTKNQEARQYLKFDNQLRLVLDVNHNRMEMECIVIRMEVLPSDWIQYACKFAVVEKIT